MSPAARRDPDDATRSTSGGRLTDDQLRLLTKVARLYHEQGVRQPQIAAQLNLSQAKVSRLLKQAVEVGIIRTIVVSPPGLHTAVEERIQQRFGLRDVVVIDAPGDTDEAVIPALGGAAAAYLETTLTGADRVGISSWSSTLLATVDAMQPRNTKAANRIVQVLGGVGTSSAQALATRLTGQLAELTGAEPVFLPAPGLVGSKAALQALRDDPSFASLLRHWDDLTTVLVGIGSLEPSPLLKQSGNAIAEEEQERLRALGAVGDVCLRFFRADGAHVSAELDERVLGISPEQLARTDRIIGVAGGVRKYSAILAALRGGWLNVLVTDVSVAKRLADEQPTT